MHWTFVEGLGVTITGVAKNLITKGPAGMLRIRKERKLAAQRKAEEAARKAAEKAAKDARAKALIAELKQCCANRVNGELELTLEEIAPLEHELRDNHKKAYKQYKKYLQSFYLKTVLPARYERLSKNSVQDKVVFMEKNAPDNPPNGYISRVLAKQGKYQVIKMGLGLNGPTRIGYYENCVKFVEEIADAKAVFISSSNLVLSQFDMRPETKLIQLWHGLGMFKKCGFSTIESKGFGSSASKYEEYNPYRNYSYVCLPAMEQAWTFEDSMHIPVDSGILVPVGVSRTDRFYNPRFEAKSRARLLELFPQIGDKKIIFYAPTYRGRTTKATAPKALDIEAMAQALADEYVLLIKHHSFAVADRPPIPAQWENTFAFDMNKCKGKGLGIERLLAVADICITDYSSIGFEYALLERPLIFFAFDLDEYLDQRGMYWDYDDITPGPVCKTTEEMVDYIKHIDERFDLAEVQAFKKKYVGACDGHSTERTIALIEAEENPRLTFCDIATTEETIDNL